MNFEPLKSAREKSDPERSAPLRFAETIFARISPIDWFFMSAAPSIFVSTACSRLALLRSPIKRAPERFAPFRLAPCSCIENIIAPRRSALVRFAPSAKLTVRLHRERLALARLLRFRIAAARFAPLKSMPDRSSPERFLEYKSAGAEVDVL